MSDKKTKITKPKSKDTTAKKVKEAVKAVVKAAPKSTKLKRRKAVAPVKAVVNKARKMIEIKRHKQKAECDNPANSSMLIFPTDKLGITGDLKTAYINTASKVGTSKEAMQLIEDTTQILRGHLQARFKQNQARPSLKARKDTRLPEVIEAELEDATEDKKES